MQRRGTTSAGKCMVVNALAPSVDDDSAGRDPDALAPSRSEFHLSQAQQLARVGSWEWDASTGHLTVTPEMRRIYGPSAGAELGPDAMLEMVHPDDRARFVDARAEVVARREPQLDFECRMLRPDGEVRVTHLRHLVIYDAAGEVQRVVGTVQDITEQRQAEQALADSERTLRDALANASDIVTVIDPDGVFEYSSPSIERLLGYLSSVGSVVATAHTPPIDIAGFHKTMRDAGAEAAVDGILDTFIAGAPARSAAVAEALRVGDGGRIRFEAHAYKSSAALIGAHALAADLLAIEVAGRDGRIDEARALGDAVRDGTTAVLAFLQASRTPPVPP